MEGSSVAKRIYNLNTAIESWSWRWNEGWVARSLYSADQECSARRRGSGIPVPSYLHRHVPFPFRILGRVYPAPFLYWGFLCSVRDGFIFYILSPHVDAHLLYDLNSRSDYLQFLMVLPHSQISASCPFPLFSTAADPFPCSGCQCLSTITADDPALRRLSVCFNDPGSWRSKKYYIFHLAHISRSTQVLEGDLSPAERE